MTESDLKALTRLIDELNESTGDLAASSVEQTKVQAELREELAGVKKALPTFVPKRRFWVAIAGVLAALGLLVAIAVSFRVRDDNEARQRREQATFDAEQDRQNSIRGCGRSNDLRAMLREVIEIAYAPQPVPANVPAELLPLVIQGQERQAAKRLELLSKEGVQHVDCEAQFPPPQGQP